MLLAALRDHTDALQRRVIVVVEDDGVRVRPLLLSSS